MNSFLTLFGALAAVAAIIYLSYLFSKYLASGAARMGNSRFMKTVDRIALGPDRMLLIVEIGSSCYLVGSSPQSIQLLKELPADVAEEIRQSADQGSQNSQAFRNLLKDSLLKKSVHIDKGNGNRNGKPTDE